MLLVHDGAAEGFGEKPKKTKKMVSHEERRRRIDSFGDSGKLGT